MKASPSIVVRTHNPFKMGCGTRVHGRQDIVNGNMDKCGGRNSPNNPL